MTALLMLAGLALCAAAWWALRRHAVDVAAPTPVAATVPEAERARRDAAIEVARMPDDPWTFAESLAPSAPAPAKSHCGTDEQPQFADPVERDGETVVEQIKPAGPGYVAGTRRVDAALRASGDPFDRAVADWLNVGDVRTTAERQDVLVQQATNTSDPRIYALAYGACVGKQEQQPSCQLLSARQWASLDPGNALPWLYLFDQAHASGDASGQQEALAHMASSSRFDTRFFAAAGAVAAHVPDDEADLAAAADLTTRAVGMEAATVLPVSTLMMACRNKAGGDANRVQQCQGVSGVMFDHADSLMMRGFGGALYLQSTGDASRRDIARAERTAFGAHWSPATGFSECQQIRDGLKRMVRSAKLGEVEAAREEARTFVTP